VGDEDDYVIFELRNRGRQATTVEAIMFVEYSGWFARLTKIPSRVENVWVGQEKDMKLPGDLLPGGVWKGSCPLQPRHEQYDSKQSRSRRQRLEAGRLFYRVQFSHTDRFIAGTVKPEIQMRRM
jgi:hypothetical protein